MPDPTAQKLYNDLTYYTLSHPDPAFLHQHVVDAFAVQTADGQTKPITVIFGLAGLYLAVEKGYTGKQVQNVHIVMARTRKIWPVFLLPDERGDITVSDVLSAPPGRKRDCMIMRWCRSVWGACKPVQPAVREIVKDSLDIR